MCVLEHPLEPSGSRHQVDTAYTDGVSESRILFRVAQSSKAPIRKMMRARRRGLDSGAQQLAARRLAHQLERLRIYRPGRCIAFYLANDGEIDPHAAMRKAAKAGVRCYVPIVPRPGSRRLRFAEITDTTRFLPNRFGIPEPCGSVRTHRSATELDWILLPLVAFDRSGNRLGMGGGFYDTTLAARRTCRYFHRPAIVGLAHECQRLESIETEVWDIPLNRIVTDQTVYNF